MKTEGNLLIYPDYDTYIGSMAKEKKRNVDDIEKLRKILDNPSDPSAAQLLSTNDAAINSVRQRLTHKQPAYRTLPTHTTSKVSLSLQPTVTIRTRMKQTTMISSFSPVAPLPEFEPVSTTPVEETPVFTPVTTEEPLFDDEDLIEIEKAEMTYPEFSAVGPTDGAMPLKDITIQSEEAAPSETPAATETELPHWQPVTETPTYEPTVTDDEPSAEEVPEFTRLSPQIPQEASEKPTAWQPVESVAPALTKQQFREQKKLEQQKQKEAKRKIKMERRQARIDARQKKQEAKQQLKMQREQAQREAQPKEQETLPLTSEQTEVSQPPEAPLEKVVPEVEQAAAIKVDLSAFKGIESIDEHTGELLFRNGYFSLDDLRKATIDDLVHIRGVKRKLAKKIKKEVEQKPAAKPDEEFVAYKKKARPKKSRIHHEDVTEWESFSVNNNRETSATIPATYGKYTLYKRARGKGAKKTTIHFFSKEKSATGTPVPLPKGYEIAVNKKTRVPYLKKKK